MKYFASGASLSPYTHNTRRKKLKPFFAWLVEESYISAPNPMDKTGKKKEDERPKAHNENALKRLLALPDHSDFVELRDYAVFMLTLDCGIRPSEVFGLKIEDVVI